jgi:hypothetical protein
MRKFIIAAVLSLLSFAAFAQIDLSLGAGGYYSPYWFTGRAENSTFWSQAESSYGFYGAKAFCDLTYVSADIGITLNTGESHNKTTTSLGSTTTSTTALNQGVWLTVGAVAKYPIKSGGVTVFPAFGIEYDMLLSMYNDDGDDIKPTLSASSLDSLNRLWLKAGIGADIDVGGNFFFRPEADFCYKLSSSFDSDQIEIAKNAGYASTRTYLRVDISLSVGYRL